jgi:hypothetical protein
VVDHVVVAEPFTVLGLDVAQHREQVVGGRGPFRRQVPAQELLQQRPAAVRPMPGRPGHVEADQRAAGLHACDERLVDRLELVVVGEVGAAHEDLGGEVEGQRLQRRVRREVPAGLPAVEPRRDRRGQRRGVPLDPGPGEGLLQDQPVLVVLGEVEQHQAAAEERPDQEPPARAVGERLVAVAQRGGAGVGADEQRPAQRPHHPQLGDRAVRVVALAHEGQRVAHVREGLPDQGEVHARAPI